MFYLGYDSGAFHAFSKQATLVAQSSTHAEIMALFLVACTVEFVWMILEFVQIEMTGPTKIFVDNKSAVMLCETVKSTPKTGSINMQENVITRLINRKIISLHFIRRWYYKGSS